MIHTNDKGFVLCPCCGKPTKVKVVADTVLRNFPLFCPWCKKESMVSK